MPTNIDFYFWILIQKGRNVWQALNSTSECLFKKVGKVDKLHQVWHGFATKQLPDTPRRAIRAAVLLYTPLIQALAAWASGGLVSMQHLNCRNNFKKPTDDQYLLSVTQQLKLDVLASDELVSNIKLDRDDRWVSDVLEYQRCGSCVGPRPHRTYLLRNRLRRVNGGTQLQECLFRMLETLDKHCFLLWIF